MKGSFIVKASGKTQAFSKKKLKLSLKRTGAPRFIVNEIADQVASQVPKGSSTRQIYHFAQQKLKKESRFFSYRYSLKRGIFELGPSGFPFEQLVSRLMQKMGYDTTTGQIIPGVCVDHEIDVLATTRRELSWIECKFHNVQGTIVDLKTALYVFGRNIDLRENSTDLRKSTMWLATNTRLSSEAQKLCDGRGIRALSWDRPAGRSLSQLLETHHLYPITCATHIKRRIKLALIARGVVTFEDFLENPQKTKGVGLSENERKQLTQDFTTFRELSFPLNKVGI